MEPLEAAFGVVLDQPGGPTISFTANALAVFLASHGAVRQPDTGPFPVVTAQKACQPVDQFSQFLTSLGIEVQNHQRREGSCSKLSKGIKTMAPF